MCSGIDMYTHVAVHTGPSPSRSWNLNSRLRVRIWPFDLRVSASRGPRSCHELYVYRLWCW